MIDYGIDYPEFKRLHPDKTMDDWLKYSKQKAYDNSLKLFEEMMSNSSPEELEEAQAYIDELKAELHK